MTGPYEDDVMSTVAVLTAYENHMAELTMARALHRRGDDPGLAEHALDALEASQAIVDDLWLERMPIVRDALTFGATVTEVAERMHNPVREVVAGLQGWADVMCAVDAITTAERRRVRRLLIGAVQ
jgi:hypothetical protein